VVSARVLGLGEEYTLRRRNAIPRSFRVSLRSFSKPSNVACPPLPETPAVNLDPREGQVGSHLFRLRTVKMLLAGKLTLPAVTSPLR